MIAVIGKWSLHQKFRKIGASTQAPKFFIHMLFFVFQLKTHITVIYWKVN